MNHYLTEYALRSCERARHIASFHFDHDNREEGFTVKRNWSASMMAALITVFILASLSYTTTSQATCTYFNDFKENQDGTVTDPRSGLVWQKCALGQTWDGSTCSGQATLMFWEEAMQAAKGNRFLGKNNWRLPKLSEFRRVIGDDRECSSSPRAVSSRLAYPIRNDGRLGNDFWASTIMDRATQTDERSLTGNDLYASIVSFENGGFGEDYINYQRPVRLVRNGPRTSAQGAGESSASPPEMVPPISKAQCVIKPVMTDEEIERCKGGEKTSSDADRTSAPSRPRQQNLQLANKLKGEWIIDAKATENFVLSAPPPPNANKLAEWFGLVGGYLALYTYEFNGDSAMAHAYRGARILEFKISSQQDTEIKYSLKNDTSLPARTLSVSMLKNGNIKIVPSEAPEMGYLLWKRGSLKTEKVTPDDVMVASKTWLASVQNIVKFLNKPSEKTPKASIPIETEDPRPSLEAAIRNGVIRRATPADAQAWLDADSEKYRRKNLSPPNNSHEASILNTAISKADAYVVLKKFTYPPGLMNSKKAIFLIPRGTPVPDGNYGHSKIYRFYDEYFMGTSVEFTADSPW